MLRKIKILLNPFDVVRYNSDDQPDSRSLHTSLWEKLKDTYRVVHGETLAGSPTFRAIKTILSPTLEVMRKAANEELTVAELNQFNESAPARTKSAIENFRFTLYKAPGLFDYATLGLFRLTHATESALLRTLEKDALNPEKYQGAKKVGIHIARLMISIAILPVTLPNFVGNYIARPLVALGLTVAFSPIVAFSHLVTLAVKAVKSASLAKNLEVTEWVQAKEKSAGTWKSVKHKLDQGLGVSSKMNLDKAVVSARLSKNNIRRAMTLDVEFAPKNKDQNAGRTTCRLWSDVPAQQKMGFQLIGVSRKVREGAYGEQACQPRYGMAKGG